MIKSVLLPVAGAMLCAVLIAGCSSTGADRPPANPPQPLLTGKTLFLDGKIEVAATLRGFGTRAGPPREDGGNRAAGDGERPKRRAEVRSDDGPGAGYSEERRFTTKRDESPDETAPARPPHWIGSASRQTIVITIRNLGSTAVPVNVEDVTSPIGNWVPLPGSFTLDPGAEQVLEPMRASYVSAIEEVGITVRIGSGDRREEQTVRLTVAAPPAGN